MYMMVSNLERINELLQETKERSRLLTESLPSRNNAAHATLAKIPYKAIDYREALFCRTEELARIAVEMYERNEIATAIVLTRALMENSAAMWYLMELIEDSVKNKQVGEIDDKLMRLLLGSRNETTNFNAMNVLNFLDKTDAAISGFRRNYESLCEYAHPNWLGTHYLYANFNEEKCWTDFGKNIHNTVTAMQFGLISINASLLTFKESYHLAGKLIPEFVEICEKCIAEKKRNN